jgi:hypothetical protein
MTVLLSNRNLTPSLECSPQGGVYLTAERYRPLSQVYSRVLRVGRQSCLKQMRMRPDKAN